MAVNKYAANGLRKETVLGWNSSRNPKSWTDYGGCAEPTSVWVPPFTLPSPPRHAERCGDSGTPGTLPTAWAFGVRLASILWFLIRLLAAAWTMASRRCPPACPPLLCRPSTPRWPTALAAAAIPTAWNAQRTRTDQGRFGRLDLIEKVLLPLIYFRGHAISLPSPGSAQGEDDGGSAALAATGMSNSSVAIRISRCGSSSFTNTYRDSPWTWVRVLLHSFRAVIMSCIFWATAVEPLLRLKTSRAALQSRQVM